MTWADRHGPGGHRRLIINDPGVLTGFRQAVFHAVPPQLDGDLGRHRPVHRRHRLRRRRLRAQDLLVRWVSWRRWFPRRLAAARLYCLACFASPSSCWCAKLRGAILYGILSATVLAIIVERSADRAQDREERQGSWSSPTSAGAWNVPKLPSGRRAPRTSDCWATSSLLELLPGHRCDLWRSCWSSRSYKDYEHHHGHDGRHRRRSRPERRRRRATV